MDSLDKVTDINSLHTDFQAEFVAACLIESGLGPDEVRIIREGLSKGGKNISRIVWEESYDKFSKYLTIYSRKRDLYESLPEGLFHRRMDIDDKKDKQAVIDYFRHERQVALSASYFFKPFEISIDRLLVDARLYEVRLERREKYDDFIRLFSSVCPLLRGLPLDKSLFVVSIFSQVYRLTTAEDIAEILAVLFECEVDIDLKYRRMSLCSEQCGWRLGVNRLSVSTVLGNVVSDYFPVMDVRVASLPSHYKELLFENSMAYRKLMEIMDMFVPADTEIHININMAKEGVRFLLADDGNAPILGYSTVLS